MVTSNELCEEEYEQLFMHLTLLHTYLSPPDVGLSRKADLYKVNNESSGMEKNSPTYMIRFTCWTPEKDKTVMKSYWNKSEHYVCDSAENYVLGIYNP